MPFGKRAGYTHYWTISRDFTPGEWSRIVNGAKKIIEAASGKPNPHQNYYEDEVVQIAGPMGSGRPILNNRRIALNGKGPKLDHETFLVYRRMQDDGGFEDGKVWNFTKTARKPYDIVVTSILALMKKVAPDAIELKSDGGMSVFSPSNTIQPGEKVEAPREQKTQRGVELVDVKDGVMTVNIKGKTYAYRTLPGDRRSIEDIARVFGKMLDQGSFGGRALAWLKKNTELVAGGVAQTRRTIEWDAGEFLDAATARSFGDRRFNYVPFHKLDPKDQAKAVRMYPHKAGGKYEFKDEHYYYPVNKAGRLAEARRVLAIPLAAVRDDGYMQNIGYKVSPNWRGAAQRSEIVRSIVELHLGKD